MTAALFLPAFLVLIAAALQPAKAGDFANTEIMGFSKDGRYFAFEEYGIQDGSGFPYSSIYVINVEEDRWVDGSPFRKVDEVIDPIDFDAALASAREDNLARARALLEAKGIGHQGLTVGHNPRSELSADPHVMSVWPRVVVPPIDEPIELTLEEFELPNAKCESYSIQTKGFRLALSQNGKTQVLNDDASVPDSRKCPLRYRIERVVTYYPDPRGAPVFAVLILMESHGFEGPDGRFLAVTGVL
ncbi:DUF2259 domain-containing protein [Stappia sp. GBMRC 2046]|uniref:DUF2259 domain-containing protein n=2 Tax=Stappia sediminis TaxID=2692190 RepID=A0A7X3S694_9HYPH|nr:DUF2259 domain-containing protein [Stappia sediminis]